MTSSEKLKNIFLIKTKLWKISEILQGGFYKRTLVGVYKRTQMGVYKLFNSTFWYLYKLLNSKILD